jgi:hypothetical protein
MAGGIPSRRARPPSRPAELDAAAARSGGQVRLGLTPRRSVAAARAEAAQSLQRFVRQEYWNGLATGDVVRVAGHTARGRHWRFRAHVTNSSNGATWVEVALVDGPAPSKRPALAASVGAPDELLNGARRQESSRFARSTLRSSRRDGEDAAGWPRCFAPPVIPLVQHRARTGRRQLNPRSCPRRHRSSRRYRGLTDREHSPRVPGHGGHALRTLRRETRSV